MPPRSIATGTISFGLVAIPIKLYTTTESANRVSFSMVHKECGSRVRYRYYCPTDDRLIERDEITKGYEFSKGQYVLFSQEELKAIDPEPTNAVEIKEFVPLEQVDPVYFEKAYYLGPDKGGAKPYRLLSQTLRKSKRAALAKYAARGKNYLVLLRPFEEGLVMQQLRYPEDLKAFSEVPIDDAEIDKKELDLAMQLVEQTASKSFKPDGYSDEVRKQVWDMIEQKIRGEEIVAPPEEEPKAQIIDLMEALKASLGESGESKRAGKTRKPPKRAPRKPAAKKKAAKRASRKK
ncbi:MAG: Ku protein [Acidobacteriota bacterium]|nr:Ku protein [Acidobacteriota bacterium]